MNFNKHFDLEGKHAFLSPSKYYWTNYTPEQLESAFNNFAAAARGSELHEHAKRCIELGTKLQKSKKTLNMYVNDAIGFQMTPEQPLYYSENCFGTADAISFKNGMLRIHDLKTGVTPASIKQLYIYDALYCLDYNRDPKDIQHELRIYQNDDVVINKPDPNEIRIIMDKMELFDKTITDLKDRGEL